MNLKAKVERIDHLGILAGVIKDLKIIELIDERIPTDSREVISVGEAVAAMIINSLGFSDRPMTLTPQFFENKPMDRLFRPGIKAEHFNRFKLGRALDDCHSYGCDTLFAELSAQACQQEEVELRFNSLDTTAFALTGEYDKSCDEHTISITHGYSKDHRPDLKQAVLEMMCTQDGGIPVISQVWNGNASDTKIFRERAQDLIDSFKAAEAPRYLIADAKLYDKETASNFLCQIPFITRIPGTIKKENEMISKALEEDKSTWQELDEKHSFKTFEVEHYDLKQRWIVVSSKEAKARAEKSVEKKCEKEKENLKSTLKSLEKKSFSCSKDARQALLDSSKKAKFHEVVENKIQEVKKYTCKGRPKKDSPYELTYHISALLKEKKGEKKSAIKQKSCFVVGTTVLSQELNDKEVIAAYKGQNTSIERGFRFLKDPLMFTSSLFVKKAERIMGLLMVMTLGLLVYSIAQRRLRKSLEELKETLPNQIRIETKRPALRWVFQMLDGIEFVQIEIGKVVDNVISGITEIRKRILSYFGSTVQKIYELNPTPAPSG